MENTEENQPKNLRELRQCNGLSLGAVAKLMSEYDGKPPRSRTVIYKFEERGTRNIDVLRAFAHAFDLSLDDVDEAARHGVDNEANKVLSEC